MKDKGGQLTRDDLREYKGLCLWIKGDGSDAAAVFTTNSGYSNNKFRVPLKDTKWHKVFMPWYKWQEPITGHWWFLTYGLERSDQGNDNWYIVDRVHLYKEEKTEPIQPTPDIDPRGMVPAKAFVSGRDPVPRKAVCATRASPYYRRACIWRSRRHRLTNRRALGSSLSSRTNCDGVQFSRAAARFGSASEAASTSRTSANNAGKSSLEALTFSPPLDRDCQSGLGT